MKKYRVYGIMTASVFLGEVEAECQEQAIERAESNGDLNWNPQLCHQCSDEVELGEVYEIQVEEI